MTGLTIILLTAVTLPTFTKQEVIQAAVSQKLVELETQAKHARRERMEVTLADIHAVLEMSPERLRMLKLGMNGAIEAAAEKLRPNQLRNLEQRLTDVTPETIDTVLKNYRSGYTLNNPEESAEWRTVLARVLTKEEFGRWQAAVEERKRYRQQAITEVLALEAEARVGLSTEQLSQLRPHLEKAVADFLPDLSSMYSDDNDRSIYTEYVPVLLMGIQETTVKSIVTDPEQWKKWEAAPGQYRSNWDWIKRNHESRLKREAKGL